MATIDLRTAAQLNTDLLVSQAKYQGFVLLKLAEKWVERQGDIWPETITAQTLVAKLELAYLAHWILSGDGSATWSAAIGKEQKRLTLCPTCKGNGIISHPDGKVGSCTTCNSNRQVEETYVDWTNQSGVAHHHIHQQRELNVTYRYRPQFRLRGDLSLAQKISRIHAEQYPILPPESTSAEAGRRVLDALMKDTVRNKAERAAQDLGQVKNLNVAYVTVNHAEVATWLYPVYVGTYVHEGELLAVMVDGLTGEFWAEAPASVRQARQSILLQWIAVIVLIIGLLIMAWMLYQWL